MFALVDALDGSGSLRRTLTDPSIDAEAKAGLARRLLGGADPAVADVVADLVSQRWSSEDDLTESIEELGFWALLASADAAGDLVRVGEGLFRLTRALAHQSGGARALGATAAALEVAADIPGPARRALVSLWRGDDLVAVPPLGVLAEDLPAGAVEARFLGLSLAPPRQELASACRVRNR